MTYARQSLGAALAVLAITACSQPPSREAGPERHFTGGTFTSSRLPRISIRVEEDFQYLGATAFELAVEAQVDRHHLVDVGGDGQVEFVRIVDEEAKHEFIIFYLEPLAPSGFRASQFVEGGAGAAIFDRLSAEVTARSLAVFRVEAG